MKKIDLGVFITLLLSGCSLFMTKQYENVKLTWTSSHKNDDATYEKAVDCATRIFKRPQNGAQFFSYESDKLHKFIANTSFEITYLIQKVYVDTVIRFDVNKGQVVIEATDPQVGSQNTVQVITQIEKQAHDIEEKFKTCVEEKF
jgi:hypothetical protein